MTIKLVAIDMDGTLLNSQGKIQLSTVVAVKKALTRDVKIVLCSGRPFAGLTAHLKELGISGPDEYVVTLNGAITQNTAGKVITEDLIPTSCYRQMTAFSVAHCLPVNIVDTSSRIITPNHNIDLMVYIQAYENLAPLYVRTPDELAPDHEIAKGCFVGSKELLDKYETQVKQKFDEKLTVARTDKHFIELINPAVNKGNGLRELCQALGIPANSVMAIGDERNDISMFDFAGIAICMGNGHAEAKKHADYVTTSNDADGISNAFAKFIFKN
ncbi:Cof-type HAD-IIB family hydrolase [Lactobacillus sp. ESL0791]|uniref:Cof-type HAD-IIB family hydrolase n=1 Tax=Lactobacillus sp. ESL0791 TaxID=2983234 RepID=UPI0023F6763C|nr:Cof-type HAD-IIB family hydrolase [Lactobacillus sp. ESL0791]MDF7639341.1 Cof-type HAD-IIB family hydrolase [Lactobacillus sp. ESL0791]